MGQKQCHKCSEMVDEAKAFCPGCGTAFVEEEQRQQSKFESLDHTVQMGQTMYNQMLSDMGLNIKKPVGDKNIEVIKPLAAVPARPATIPVSSAPEKAKKPSSIWLLIGGLILVGLLIVITAAALFFMFWERPV